MKKECLKIGMIGAGAWSKIQLDGWRKVRGGEVVALCDRHPERRDPVAREFGIPRLYDDFRTMVEDKSIDAVDICTRPYSHLELGTIAAEHGKPVLCQKPFCENNTQAGELVKRCKQAGVPLMVNENFRWMSWYREIKKLVDRGAIGKPFFIGISTIAPTPEKWDQQYLSDMPRLIILEIGCHYLDVLRFLFGEPDSVSARAHRTTDSIMGENLAQITVGYPELTASLHLNWALPHSPKLLDRKGLPGVQINGTEGTICIDADPFANDSEMRLCAREQETAFWRFSGRSKEFVAAAQQHFVDCLSTGADFETSGAEYMKTMALVHGCYESIETSRVVRVKQAG